MNINELKQVMKYSDEILELIELQVRNNNNTLTTSDLQGVVDALVHKIIIETKKDVK